MEAFPRIGCEPELRDVIPNTERQAYADVTHADQFGPDSGLKAIWARWRRFRASS